MKKTRLGTYVGPKAWDGQRQAQADTVQRARVELARKRAPWWKRLWNAVRKVK